MENNIENSEKYIEIIEGLLGTDIAYSYSLEDVQLILKAMDKAYLLGYKRNYKMKEFTKHKRKGVSEMRNIDSNDIFIFEKYKKLTVKVKDQITEVSISEADLKNGSPKMGDKIARNPKDHSDQWLVAEKYYNDNLEPFYI